MAHCKFSRFVLSGILVHVLPSPSVSTASDLIRDVIAGHEELAIPIVDTKGISLGSLQPLTRRHLCDDALLALLTRWRNAARFSFFTQFEATIEGTHAWLRDRVLTDCGRLLFIVDAGPGPVGTIGLIKLTETGADLDNLIRGERVGPPTLFLHAERCLVRWLFITFVGLREIEAAVLAGNFAALQLHQSIGFEVKRKAALRRFVRGETTMLVPAGANEEGQGDAALYLVLDRDTFQFREQETPN
jgi:RimJ/RimL family protein N-acetyltransferase